MKKSDPYSKLTLIQLHNAHQEWNNYGNSSIININTFLYPSWYIIDCEKALTAYFTEQEIHLSSRFYFLYTLQMEVLSDVYFKEKWPKSSL